MKKFGNEGLILPIQLQFNLERYFSEKENEEFAAKKWSIVL